MSRDLHTAAAITPPISGSDDMYRIASSGTATRVLIPRAWLESWITVTMEGVSGHVALTKDITLALDGTDVSTVDGTTYAVTAHGTAEGKYIPQDGSEPFDLSKLPDLRGDEQWYLAHVESGTGGYVEVRRSSGPAKGV